MKLFVPLIALFVTLSARGCHMEEGYFMDKTYIPIQVEDAQFYEALSLNDIEELSGGTVDVVYFPDIDIPKEITGVFSPGTIKTPEDAVLALTSVRDIMCIDSFSFVCVEIEERKRNRMFHLQQVYKGLSVENGNFRVVAGYDGEPLAVAGLYIAGIDLDITPKLTSREGERYTKIDSAMKVVFSELVIYQDAEKMMHLSWKYNISSKNPLEAKTVFVDAKTGEFLAETPVAIS
jgi:hypothetical protein